MFTELAPLASKATLLIIAAPVAEGRLRLTITVKADADSNTSLATYQVEGTPPELDAGLPDSLQKFTQKNIGLAEANSAADAEIAAITKEKQLQVAAARRPAGKPEAKKTPAVEAPAASPTPETGTLSLNLESEPAAPVVPAATNT